MAYSGVSVMTVYLYLTKPEWTVPWTQGGTIPISLASAYRSTKRRGIFTPDENLINDLHGDLSAFSPLIESIPNFKDCAFVNNTANGPIALLGSRYFDDGLVLSFCVERSWMICRKLGKTCCVKIHDVESLKLLVDEQLGEIGISARCQYTDTHQRNHFLKSTADSWQMEHRLFWAAREPAEVLLPPGIGTLVQLRNRYFLL